MVKVRKELQRIVTTNRARDKHDTYYMSLLTESLQQPGGNSSRKEMAAGGSNLDQTSKNVGEYLDYIRDIR
jgi:hypothetical protein